jgi:uncharacterized membrane protein YedE/YeeE
MSSKPRRSSWSAGLLGLALAGLISAPAWSALARFERDVDHVDAWVRPNVLLVATAAFSLGGTLAVDPKRRGLIR